jgi:hypothetical protein
LILLIIAGLIIEQLSFYNHMVIGEICVWAGIITTVIPILWFLIGAAAIGHWKI